MSENKDNDKNKSGNKTLSLRRSLDQFQVKQSFSSRRSKTVIVETKRKRGINRGSGATIPPLTQPSPAPIDVQREKTPPTQKQEITKKDTQKDTPSSIVLRSLSDKEKKARADALEKSKIREEQNREIAQQKAKEQAEKETHENEEKQRAKERKKAEENRHKEEEIAKQVAEKAALKLQKPDHPAPKANYETPKPDMEEVERREIKTPISRKRHEERRRSKLTIANAFDSTDRPERSLASIRRRQEKQRAKTQIEDIPKRKISREVIIPETITIRELSNRMAERGVDVIRFLMAQGEMHKITDIIDADTAQIITEEFGHVAQRVSEADIEEGLGVEEENENALQPRAPVVTIMGHVDHGKTTLLDALRKTNITAGESGGITQHIGAYQVHRTQGEEEKTQSITFIDTPGHEAFTSMRARGAKVTDIAIIVVAADDGVKPQTIEAISHARSAEIPMIVAINKMDKPGVDPTRLRSELLQHGVHVETMGGDVLEVEISALKKTGLEALLDAIFLQAEILELTANLDRNAEGVVIESHLDQGKGFVATILIQKGTLNIGDIFVAGMEWGRVRALVDDRGKRIKKATVSMPIEVLGFNGAPEAGEKFIIVETDMRAREISEYRTKKRRDARGALAERTSLEQFVMQTSNKKSKELPLLIKTDTQGSAEAITQALDKIISDEVRIKIIYNGVGGINESDITLSQTTQAIIIGFNVRANIQARAAAEKHHIDIRYYNVIYHLINDIKQVLSGLLPPEKRETFIGRAEIAEVFTISKIGKIAGCRIDDGSIVKDANLRLIRDDRVVHEGNIAFLKHFKQDVAEVKAGQECGIAFANWQDLKEKDIIECYKTDEIARTID